MTDLLLEYRRRAADGVATAIDRIDYTHAELLRREAVHAQAVDLDLMGAAACLYTAEALGGDGGAALPAATALALLEMMADVFRDISEESPGRPTGLLEAWGMPRTLNAGDALFVLAQQCAIEAAGDDSTALRAAEVFDIAARDLSESLPATATERLLPAALSLAALSAGTDAAVADGLAEVGRGLLFGRGGEERLKALNLPPEQRERLELLTSYLSEVRAE